MGHGADGDVARASAPIGRCPDRRLRLISGSAGEHPALLLSDSRFPAGGHAHSGGVEPAVTAGTVSDLASLEAFLRGRLRTAGLVAAGLAAAACVRAVRIATTAETDVAAVPGADRSTAGALRRGTGTSGWFPVKV